MDIHAYLAIVADTTNYTNAQKRAAAGNLGRTYWDPTYTIPGDDQDWITTTQPNRAALFMIPRLKALTNAIYPGTPLSFSEWEPFVVTQGEWDFATALSDAEIWGVAGREGLSFSTRWGGPDATDTTTNLPHPNFQALKPYTDYDGTHHQFGSLSVSDQNSSTPDPFTSYAALDASGTTMTFMVLNKDPDNAANVAFNLNGFNASTYTAYTLASTNPGAITASTSQGWSASQAFAPYSITLLVVSGTQASKPESEWYLNPDDLMIPASGASVLNPKIALFRANIDTAIINVGHEDLSHYKLVIVPADYVMDEASANQLREYVSNGGTVLMTAYSAKEDEHSLWFDTPLPGRLSDVFGLKTNAFYDGGPLKFELDGKSIETTAHRYEVLEPSTATVVARFTTAPQVPALTVNRFGKGKAAYLATESVSSAVGPVLLYLGKLAGVQLGPQTPVGVYARVVDGRTLYINTTDEEKRIPINGRKKGIITGRVYEGAVTLLRQGADLIE